MAEDKKITIEIIGYNGDGVPGPGGTKTKKENESSKLEELSKNYWLKQSYQLTKQVVSNALKATVNRYFALEEDYMNQMDYQNFMATLGIVEGFGKGILSGAISGGAVAGPGGAAAGAVLGVLKQTISLGFEERQIYSQAYQQINANNINMDYSRSRAGLVSGSRGTEN